MEKLAAQILVYPITQVYALLWRLGLLELRGSGGHGGRSLQTAEG